MCTRCVRVRVRVRVSVRVRVRVRFGWITSSSITRLAAMAATAVTAQCTMLLRTCGIASTDARLVRVRVRGKVRVRVS